VDPHRRAEVRSLAYHRVVAERLLADPSVLARARERVRAWMQSRPEAPYVRGWDAVLQLPPADIAAFLVDAGDHATELRQSTPFAGALAPRERWLIWRSTGARP
jgi:hypothetical protein